MRRVVAALFLVLCCTTFSGAVGGAPTASPQDDDERNLWLRAQEEEQRIDTSKSIYRNPEMERYLDGVIRNVVPADQLAKMAIRVSIIKNRSCNAFMFPNGRAYVHTGLLAAMENESQLAAVLAHESVHALHRHMLREVQDSRAKMSFTAVLGALTGNLLTPFGQLAALASVKGYSRDLETEADREGFRLLVQAGYDPYQAPKAFQVLLKEIQDDGEKEPYFFASHPNLQARIDNMNELLKGMPPAQGKTNQEAYLQTFAPLLLDSADMNLKAGRYQRARGCASRYLAARGDNARAYLLMGESYRQDGKPDLAKAREYYRKAAALDPGYAEAHRMLGLVAYKQHDREQARTSLGRYLELSATAPDRGYIEQMLSELR